MDDGGSESKDGPVDLTLAGTEDSDEEAATEAERDNPSVSSEPPDESTRDTSLGITSHRGASPRYASPRYASPRYASPQYASPHYASSDFTTSWSQSNPRFSTEESSPSTYMGYQPFPRGRCHSPHPASFANLGGHTYEDRHADYAPTGGRFPNPKRWTGTGSHKSQKKRRMKTASGLPAS